MAYLGFKTRSLLYYLWHGKSRYHVHSDFVFSFINLVLRNKKAKPEFAAIEQLRASLLRDGRIIEASDYGANTSAQTTVKHKVRQTAIRPLYGRLLHRSVEYFDAQNILEIGTGTGISSLYMASLKNVRQFISLEGNPSLATIAQEQAKKMGLEHCEFVVGNFNSTLLTALGKLNHVDFAFVDGNHQKEATLNYYHTILPYTHNNTVLVFDDIHWSPDMQQAWHEIISRPEVTLSIDFYQMGFVFFRKEFRQPQRMQLYYW